MGKPYDLLYIYIYIYIHPLWELKLSYYIGETLLFTQISCVSWSPKLLAPHGSHGLELLIFVGSSCHKALCFPTPWVNVCMVVANIANMGISINSAVNSGFCGRVNRQGPINKVSGRRLHQSHRGALPGLAGRQRPVRRKHLRHRHRCRCHRPLRCSCACGLCKR